MLLIEKDNMVDGSCYVAVYESRKLGNSNKRGFVLVGKTETVTTEPKYPFLNEYIYHVVLNLLSVFHWLIRVKIFDSKCMSVVSLKLKTYPFRFEICIVS